MASHADPLVLLVVLVPRVVLPRWLSIRRPAVLDGSLIGQVRVWECEATVGRQDFAY